VQSLAGGFVTSNWKQRPFRSPHHTTSGPALVGGGLSIPPKTATKQLNARLSHCDRSLLDAT
jgi:predicted ATPase with chaperone activity